MTHLSYASMYWARWLRWRRQLNGTGFNTGSALTHELGSPLDVRPGLPDAVHAGGRVLGELEAKGYIERGAFNPTQNQRFLGANGGWKDKQMRGDRTLYDYKLLKPLPAEPWNAMDGVDVPEMIATP